MGRARGEASRPLARRHRRIRVRRHRGAGGGCAAFGQGQARCHGDAANGNQAGRGQRAAPAHVDRIGGARIGREIAPRRVHVRGAADSDRLVGGRVQRQNARRTRARHDGDGPRIDGGVAGEEKAGEKPRLRLLDDDLDGQGVAGIAAQARWPVHGDGCPVPAVDIALRGRDRLGLGDVAGSVVLGVGDSGGISGRVGRALHRVLRSPP